MGAQSTRIMRAVIALIMVLALIAVLVVVNPHKCNVEHVECDQEPKEEELNERKAINNDDEGASTITGAGVTGWQKQIRKAEHGVEKAHRAFAAERKRSQYTGQTCKYFHCLKWRGTTKCVKNKCMCQSSLRVKSGKCKDTLKLAKKKLRRAQKALAYAISSCPRSTGASCRILGCQPWHGLTDCKRGKCICKRGYCHDGKGKCVLA